MVYHILPIHFSPLPLSSLLHLQGMRRPEVVKLLRDAEGKVTLVVSRQEAVELEQEQDTAHVSSDS